MIKITNGLSIMEVTSGAYKDIYKSQGYRPFDEAPAPLKEEPRGSEEAQGEKDVKAAEETKTEALEDSDEAWANELSEKPIAQWSKEEVKRFAAIRDIDLTGTKNANEAKERIKAAM